MSLRIKEICKQKNTSISELAVKIGIKQESLSRAINGNPQLETLEKIANALEVHTSELFQKDCELYGLVTYQGTTYKIETREQLMSLVEAVNGEKKGSN